MSTLSSLFGINYNYYARVNVYSLIKIVDALGGITVHSDYEFYAASGTGGYHQFYVGDNEVDGVGALCFVRERNAFENGDRQRGIHQEECIKAIIKKACSPAIIAHFTDVLSIVTSSMKTNIGQEEINALVKMQLSDMASWTVEGISVDGWGAVRPCYTAGDTELWVMIPDTATVNAAKDKIKEFLGP
jgi:anionic cell wall polymer biosynthesis LytR-Cps2A-Psr (LCP) family protein